MCVIHDDPDGTNINDMCGAIAPQSLCDAVIQHSADIGLALDGDADRIVIVDECGKIVDGDHAIAAIATNWMECGKLQNKQITVTKMSNSALDDYCTNIGISVLKTDVGDKNVVKKMIEHGCNVGGEKSGHIITLDYSTTGDGLISAIQVLNYLLRYDAKASCLHDLFALYPQICINIKNIDENNEQITSLLNDLHKRGYIKRFVIRKSGTECITRVMVESTSKQDLDHTVKILQDITVTK